MLYVVLYFTWSKLTMGKWTISLTWQVPHMWGRVLSTKSIHMIWITMGGLYAQNLLYTIILIY